MRMSRVVSAWRRKAAAFEVKRQELERAKAEFEAMRWPHPINHILPKIAKAVLAELKPKGYGFFEILGPVGICCEASIWFTKQKHPKDSKRTGLPPGLKSLTFTCCHDKNGVRLRDERVTTKECPPGSIGEMNGMNHPDVDIPADADGKWFLKYL